MTELTHVAIHEQVRRALELDDRTPRGIRLGQTQLDAVQAHHRQVSGMQDVGPVQEFAGLKVLPSRSADRLVIEYEGDPESDDEQPTTVNVPPPPEEQPE